MVPARRQLEDAVVVLRCQAGEHGAFEALIDRFEPPLRYYLAKLLPDEAAALDALQETWVLALRGIRRLRDPAAARAWLYRIAHGLAVDHVRRDVARERAEEARATEVAESVNDEFGGLRAADLHLALDRLEPHLREVLVLHFLEGYAVAQIAEIVGRPPGTVKSRMHFAKAALRKQLGEVAR